MGEKEMIFIRVFLECGDEVKMTFQEDCLDEIREQLCFSMKTGCGLSINDWVDAEITMGDEKIDVLNGRRIIGYSF